MIYTYDINNGIVFMVSEAPNAYTNANWADLEADSSIFEQWKLTGGTMVYRDGVLSIIPNEE